MDSGILTLIGIIISCISGLLYAKMQIEAKRKDDRREYLVKIIYNEKLPKSTRALASKEYIEEGYSVTKDYILQESLLDELPKESK